MNNGNKGVTPRSSTKDKDKGKEKANENNKNDKSKGILKGQTTLENRIRKVSFADTEIERRRKWEEEFEEKMLNEIKGIKQEKLELEKKFIEGKEQILEITEKLKKLEKNVDFLEAREREREEMLERASSAGTANTEGATGSQWSLLSSTSAKSTGSCKSLTEIDVEKMRKMINEQERKERVNNITIKGAGIYEGDLVKQTEEMLKNYLGLAIKVENAWLSDRVLIAKLDRASKMEVLAMRRKLIGTSIYIAHDLSYEDRKSQVEINKWVKERRDIGWNIKAGQGRIWFRGQWHKWEEREDIEKEIQATRGTDAEDDEFGCIQKRK